MRSSFSKIIIFLITFNLIIMEDRYLFATTRSEIINKKTKSEMVEKEKRLKDLISTDKNNAQLHSELADTLALLGNLEEALIEANVAISLAPDNRDVLLIRSLIYGELNESELAIKDLKKIIEINPKDAHAYFNLSIIYRQRNEYNKAIEYCKEALKRRKDSDFYYHLATIYEEIGEYEKARVYYEWTISSDRFNSQSSKIAKEKIEEIDKILAEKQR